MHRNESAVARKKSQVGFECRAAFLRRQARRTLQMRVEPLKAVRGVNPLALPALFPGFLSPFIDKGQREEESSHFLFVCRLQCPAEGQGLLASWCVSVCVCACLSQTSAPNSMTPVSIMGTILSSTCTSRMVLSIWERLPGSRLQGTHR